MSESFQKLFEARPADALKYVEEFRDHVFWKFYKDKLQKEITASDKLLRECDLAKVMIIRGYIKGIEYKITMIDRIINNLKDEIALQKEAGPVEDARQPEDEQG